MPKTIVPLPQIIPPPNINSNAALLTNIARFEALNPKERMAMQVYFRCKELQNDTSSPLQNYNPDIQTGRIALKQDASTVFGNIPCGDLPLASAVIDWANCKAVYAAIPSEVDAIMALPGVLGFVEWSVEDLHRILLYLRLEIGE
jgi:hypothetical protein